MMKKQLLIPLLSAAGGVLALALRFWQNRTGFEADTGLPVSGAPAGWCLLVLLVMLAAALGVLLYRLPPEGTPALPRDFRFTSPPLMTVTAAGALLMALSGAADLLEGVSGENLLIRLQYAADPYGEQLLETGPVFPQKVQLLLGVLGLASAAAVLLALSACRKGEEKETVLLPLLIPPIALVVRLVLTYRLDSVNPALSAYYVELLALVFLTLGFYRLSSFAFQAGQTRRFALYAAPAITLSAASLGDGGLSLSAPLLYAGAALCLLGFLTVRLLSPVVPVEVESPDGLEGELEL